MNWHKNDKQTTKKKHKNGGTTATHLLFSKHFRAYVFNLFTWFCNIVDVYAGVCEFHTNIYCPKKWNICKSESIKTIPIKYIAIFRRHSEWMLCTLCLQTWKLNVYVQKCIKIKPNIWQKWKGFKCMDGKNEEKKTRKTFYPFDNPSVTCMRRAATQKTYLAKNHKNVDICVVILNLWTFNRQ